MPSLHSLACRSSVISQSSLAASELHGRLIRAAAAWHTCLQRREGGQARQNDGSGSLQHHGKQNRLVTHSLGGGCDS